MFSQQLQLGCIVLLLSVICSIEAQATSTVTENGIISAAGVPGPTQSVSYSIEGIAAPSTIMAVPTSTETQDANPMGGSDSSLARDNQQALSVRAIMGITLAVVFSVICIVVLTICVHKRRRQAMGRAKRKTIMDAEFAPSKNEVQHIYTRKALNSTTTTTTTANVGYFDVAKPLPAVTKKAMEDDRLSRSSTIIADAAEIAQINRKASTHQKKAKEQRSATQERNQALQFLIANADNNTFAHPTSPRASDPTTPVGPDHDPNSPRAECTDNDGNAFAKRPSKI